MDTRVKVSKGPYNFDTFWCQSYTAPLTLCYTAPLTRFDTLQTRRTTGGAKRGRFLWLVILMTSHRNRPLLALNSNLFIGEGS